MAQRMVRDGRGMLGDDRVGEARPLLTHPQTQEQRRLGREIGKGVGHSEEGACTARAVVAFDLEPSVQVGRGSGFTGFPHGADMLNHPKVLDSRG